MTVRALAALALLPVGVLAAAATVVLHGRWWGLALGVGATAAVLWALPDRWWGRLPFAAAWAATVVFLTDTRPEGDLLVRGDARGYLLLGTALVVLVVGVLCLRPRRDSQRQDSESERRPS